MIGELVVNPRGYVVGTVKEADPRFAGGKFYLAKLGGMQPVLVGKVKHKRASEAEAEAKVWKERLTEEYDARLAALVNEDARDEANAGVPATAEGSPNGSAE